MHPPAEFADIVVITSGAPLAWTQINAVRRALGPFPVIEIAPAEEPRQHPGPLTAFSQALAGGVMAMTRKGAEVKIAAIVESEALQTGPALDQYVMRLPTANNLRFQDTIRKIGPRAVFVIDAGVIVPETLACIEAPFIRYRACMNPADPEAFGGYFALAAGDSGGFGASLHIIAADGGVGPVLAQQPVPAEKGDNIHTYPWRIAAHARPMTVSVLRKALAGSLDAQTVDHRAHRPRSRIQLYHAMTEVRDEDAAIAVDLEAVGLAVIVAD